ncbi:MAG: pilus assembly protein TadG-related protein [Actinomycetota bacterium]
MNSESGQVTIMALGLAMMSLSIAGLAVDGTKAFLLRRTLQNAADSATLAASGEVSRSELYRSGGRALALSPDDAARTARNYLALRSIDARVGIEVDDDDVRLVVRGSADTLFLALVGISDVPVAVESNASPVSGGLPP